MKSRNLIAFAALATASLPVVVQAQIEWNKPDPATRTSRDLPWYDGERGYTFFLAVTIKKTSDDPDALREASQEKFVKAASDFCGANSEGVFYKSPEILGEGRDKDGSVNVTLGRFADCRNYFG